MAGSSQTARSRPLPIGRPRSRPECGRRWAQPRRLTRSTAAAMAAVFFFSEWSAPSITTRRRPRPRGGIRTRRDRPARPARARPAASARPGGILSGRPGRVQRKGQRDDCRPPAAARRPAGHPRPAGAAADDAHRRRARAGGAARRAPPARPRPARRRGGRCAPPGHAVGLGDPSDRHTGRERRDADGQQVGATSTAPPAPCAEHQQTRRRPRGRSTSAQAGPGGRRDRLAAASEQRCGSRTAVRPASSSSGPLLATLLTSTPTGRSSRCSPRASSHAPAGRTGRRRPGRASGPRPTRGRTSGIRSWISASSPVDAAVMIVQVVSVGPVRTPELVEPGEGQARARRTASCRTAACAPSDRGRAPLVPAVGRHQAPALGVGPAEGIGLSARSRPAR